jgi:hypothetical protein
MFTYSANILFPPSTEITTRVFWGPTLDIGMLSLNLSPILVHVTTLDNNTNVYLGLKHQKKPNINENSMTYVYVHANFLKFRYINHSGGRLQRSKTMRIGLLVISDLDILFHPSLVFNALIKINALVSNLNSTWTAISTILTEIHWL